MRKTYILLLCLLGAAPELWSQYIPNPYFYYFNQIPCPYNSSETVNWPSNWQLYQTTDGHWDGPIDSSRCITGAPGNGGTGLVIALGQIDPQRPLFVRAIMDTLPFAQSLQPNELFNAFIYANVTPAATPLLTGSDCPDELCSGAFIGISIPDEQWVPGGATRFQTALFSQQPMNPTQSRINGESCFPTEWFDEQYFRAFILKYTFDSTANLSNATLTIRSADLSQVWDVFGIGEIVNVPAPTNPVNVRDVAMNNPWAENFLGLYIYPFYPSPQNLSYIEAYPVPNTTTPQDITLTVDLWQTLEMQPFAQFRGDLVAGSDSIRHQFTLMNNGGTICANFIDLIFEGGDEFRHAGGQIEINNAYSCMQFRSGGELRVVEGATLHYGNNGAGMLQICANGSIVLERNATLIVDCIFQISECNDALPPSEIYMDLPPGARLVFTENAWLTNRFSKQKLMHLNVRMLGGTIDDSALDPASRALIRRIYPEPPPQLADNVQLVPNPSSGPLTLRYLAKGIETLHLRWFDVQGRMVLEEKFQVLNGWNEWAPDAPNTPGYFFVEISASDGRFVQPMVRLRE